jgi:hypothetical protein
MMQLAACEAAALAVNCKAPLPGLGITEYEKVAVTVWLSAVLQPGAGGWALLSCTTGDGLMVMLAVAIWVRCGQPLLVAVEAVKTMACCPGVSPVVLQLTPITWPFTGPVEPPAAQINLM